MQGLTQTKEGTFAAAPSRMVPAPDVSLPEGVALLWPVYLVLGSMGAVAAFLLAGIEAASLTIAAFIALWAFVEPRTTLWLGTAFMIFLFVFFQTTAPLGDELPEEFFYWGIGIALITAGLTVATIFSSLTDSVT